MITNPFSSIESKEGYRTVAYSQGSVDSKNTKSFTLQKLIDIRKRNSPLITPFTTESFGSQFETEAPSKQFTSFLNTDVNFAGFKKVIGTTNGPSREPFTIEPATRIETAELSPRD